MTSVRCKNQKSRVLTSSSLFRCDMLPSCCGCGLLLAEGKGASILGASLISVEFLSIGPDAELEEFGVLVPHGGEKFDYCSLHFRSFSPDSSFRRSAATGSSFYLWRYRNHYRTVQRALYARLQTRAPSHPCRPPQVPLPHFLSTPYCIRAVCTRLGIPRPSGHCQIA